jgi:putative peptidoglycan lipid II flippase
LLRVALTLCLGYLCALRLPPLIGLDARWGTAGLTFSAGIAGWLEFLLLRRALHKQIGSVPSARSRIARLWLVAIVAAAVSWGIKRVLPFHAPLLVGPSVLIPYGAIYLAVTQALGIANLGAISRLLTRRR